jgi:hypothetical protein
MFPTLVWKIELEAQVRERLRSGRQAEWVYRCSTAA